VRIKISFLRIGQQLEIPAGWTTYPFKCLIPLEAPASTEGTYGHVRYTVKATLERSGQTDQTSKIAFTVIRHLDLNHESPHLRVPNQMEVMKRYGSWPYKSVPLRLQAKIPRSGYAPGQVVDISGWLSNRNSAIVNVIHFKLMKTITYFAASPSHRVKKQTLDVVELGTANIKSRGFTKFSKAVTIPVVAPSNINQSKVIRQTYELSVAAH
jgi:Arrestin (or S-antigen), N-terminal domain/Arrestin (or S-antigen), C-terminal domain